MSGPERQSPEGTPWRFVDVLQRTLATHGPDTPRDLSEHVLALADALWLAKRVGALDDEVQHHEGANVEPYEGEVARDGSIEDADADGDEPTSSTTSETPHDPDAPLGQDRGVGSVDVAQPRSVRMLDPEVLGNRLPLARALRPLGRRVLDAAAPLVLAEEETAELSAEAHMRLPVLKPVPRRWLRASIVVDRGGSMRPWRGLAREVVTLFEQSGLFRDVRLWSFDGDARASDATDELQVSATLEAATPYTPRALLDPAGQVVVVVSDAIGTAWRDGRVARAMSEWAKHDPVTLLQVLPEELWPRTVVGTTDMGMLRPLTPGQPNGQQRWRPSGWPFAGAGAVRVPIITPEQPDAIERWARSVAGRDVAIPARAFPVRPTAEDVDPAAEATSPEAQVASFHAGASPDARLLASLFAASPIASFEALALIRNELLSHTKPSVLAEVLFGGLFPASADPGMAYVLDREVRSRLVDDAPASLIMSTVRTVLEKLGEGPMREAAAWIERPAEHAGELAGGVVTEGARTLAHVLRRFGGAYAELVAQPHTQQEDGPRDVEVPFIGREQELARLTSTHPGRLRLVIGPRGIGVTSLLRQAEAALRRGGTPSVFVGGEGHRQDVDAAFRALEATPLGAVVFLDDVDVLIEQDWQRGGPLSSAIHSRVRDQGSTIVIGGSGTLLRSQRMYAPWFGTAEVVHLDALDFPSATALITSGWPGLSTDEIRKLLDHVGGVPQLISKALEVAHRHPPSNRHVSVVLADPELRATLESYVAANVHGPARAGLRLAVEAHDLGPSADPPFRPSQLEEFGFTGITDSHVFEIVQALEFSQLVDGGRAPLLMLEGLRRSMDDLARAWRELSEEERARYDFTTGRPKLSYEVARTTGGDARRFALIVGIDRYRHLAPLEISEQNARAMYDHLAHGLGFTSVWSILGDKATRATLDHELAELTRNARAGDLIVVYFCGHSVRHEHDGHLLLADADLKSTAVSSILLRELAHLPRRTGADVLVLLDTDNVRIDDLEVYGPLPHEASRPGSLGILAFSTLSPDDDVFATSVMDALRSELDADGDGFIDGAQLHAFVSERVQAATKGSQRVTYLTRGDPLRIAVPRTAREVQPNGITVAVLGSSRPSVTPLCTALGSELAQRGFSMVTGGSSSVGMPTAIGFRSTGAGRESRITFVRVSAADEVAAFGRATIEHVADHESRRVRIAELAQVAIVIGGSAPTAHECDLFTERGRPMVPVPGTGGLADGMVQAAPAEVAAALREGIGEPPAARAKRIVTLAERLVRTAPRHSSGSVLEAPIHVLMETSAIADRPVGDVVGGRIRATEHLVTALLQEYGAQFNLALEAVGRVEFAGDDEALGTGFLVAPTRLLTSSYVAEQIQQRRGSEPNAVAMVDFGQEVGPNLSSGMSLPVGRVLTTGGAWSIGVLEVPEEATRRALRLCDAAPADLERRIVSVIGYPSEDPRDPAASSLLRGVSGRKRVQPGELVGYAPLPDGSAEMLIHDCSTFKGNGGSPLLDLETGEVLGVHFGGDPSVGGFAVPSWEVRIPALYEVWLDEPRPPHHDDVGHFDKATIRALFEAAIAADLSDQREALWSGIEPALRASVQRGRAPAEQLLMDLAVLNRAPPLESGGVPMLNWLETARSLTEGRVESRTFADALDELTGGARPQFSVPSGAVGVEEVQVDAPLDLVVSIRRWGDTHRWELITPGMPGLTGQHGDESPGQRANILRDRQGLLSGGPTVSRARYEAIGKKLYDATPDCFREALQILLRGRRRPLAIELHTDDWLIPWELMLIKSRSAKREFLAAEHAVARLPLDMGAQHHEVPHGKVCLVLGGPPELRRKEGRLGRAVEMRLGIQIVDPTVDAVRKVIQQPSPVSMLYLAPGTRPVDRGVHLSDGVIQTAELAGPRAMLADSGTFMFLNTTMRGVDVGALAEALLRRGFGGLLVPLMAVPTEHALAFGKKVLQGILRDGNTVGEAVRKARVDFLRRCPAVLAYGYFGDVNARLQRDPAS